MINGTEYTGVCVGGPAAGLVLTSGCKTLLVPAGEGYRHAEARYNWQQIACCSDGLETFTLWTIDGLSIGDALAELTVHYRASLNRAHSQ